MKRQTKVISAFLLAPMMLVMLFQRCGKDEVPETVTDIDGNIYSTLQIGAQVWMVENLMTGRYRNGDTIFTTLPSTLDITGEEEPRFQWPYEGNERNVHLHGRLYTWFAIADARNVCPVGWHVPADAELTALENFVGGVDITASLSDFLGGYRSPEGTFDSIALTGYWWTSSQSGEESAWIRRVNGEERVSVRDSMDKRAGLAVKCLKD